MISSYKKAMTANYANFSGRTSRADYWWYFLAYIILAVTASILDAVLFGAPNGILYAIVALAHIIPGLAAVVRRLHDIGKSGWNYLWVLLPLIGAILMLVWLCSESNPGRNQYGEPDGKIPGGAYA